ncbi:transcriptional regulator [Sphaerisporangium siamense]|uniref:DNA-binding transcriptional MerR regulator n=1 Tax=Sphaerisporangium siamense TaxID=795645 RepID=A0A7W7DFD1_9ACTN|nr:MerR family transcriptional regulator [Sphaerisporangium siamense]MBB4705454.1 DNA-binding transcriptional MerR regulator [Sphaerisporangium siamense]GII86394.1 transcriptional regulator [Sphaerisporangium siamense]
MRISQLSAASGVPIPTIKYYLREGLLPQGEQTAATRAEYGDRHLRRLRLIRALLEVGRVPVATIREIITAVEDEDMPLHTMLGTAHYALASPAEHPPGDPEHVRARERVDRLIDAVGWAVHPEAPTREELAQVLVRLDQLGMPATDEGLREYAALTMRLVAEHEMGKIPFHGARETAVESLVVGTVLYGKAFDVLRRLAHESESARVLST